MWNLCCSENVKKTAHLTWIYPLAFNRFFTAVFLMVNVVPIIHREDSQL